MPQSARQVEAIARLLMQLPDPPEPEAARAAAQMIVDDG